jgi:two-component system phosphate regulon sensor histidine kinase PhoR
MRADFVANASHELRHAARLAAGVSSRRCKGGQGRRPGARALPQGHERAGRAHDRLIDDLLSLSRVEMREHLPLSERVDLNDAVRHVIQSLQPIAGQAGTRSSFTGWESPQSSAATATRSCRVFQNLVQNAIKYGKPADASMCASRARPPAAGALPASSPR